jgi:hypothetical protein
MGIGLGLVQEQVNQCTGDKDQQYACDQTDYSQTAVFAGNQEDHTGNHKQQSNQSGC